MEGVTTHSDGSACTSGASVDSKSTLKASTDTTTAVMHRKEMEGVTLHSDANITVDTHSASPVLKKKEMEGCTIHSDGSN